ncbi:hypothetical protein [Streptomyces sp. NPDC002644]
MDLWMMRVSGSAGDFDYDVYADNREDAEASAMRRYAEEFAVMDGDVYYADPIGR